MNLRLKIYLTLTFTIILQYYPVCLFAQPQIEWYRTYNSPTNGDDRVASIALDSNGNIIVSGSDGEGGYRTIKYTSNGQQLWSVRYFEFPGFPLVAKKVAIDAFNNIYVTGYNESIVTVKYNSLGILQWVRKYKGNGSFLCEPHDMEIDRNGFIYVTGESSVQTTFFDYVTIKYNSAGDSLWTRTYNGIGNGIDRAQALVIDSIGNVYITGGSESLHDTAYFPDVTTIKYDSLGNTTWINRYLNPSIKASYSYGLAKDNYGNIYTSGFTINNELYEDILTIKYNPLVQTQWVRTYNGNANSNDRSNKLIIDYENNIVVGGSCVTDTTGGDFCLLKYNINGDLIWNKTINGYLGDDMNALEKDKYSNYYFTGNLFNAKYDKDGNLKWILQSIVNLDYYNGKSMLIDSNTNIYIMGDYFTRGIKQLDLITVKFSQPISINPISTEIPKAYKLFPNYPNPFNPITNLQFDIPTKTDVRIIVYDIMGKLIEEIVKQELNSGSYKVDFDGSKYSSGIYFYRLVTEKYSETKKMILIK